MGRPKGKRRQLSEAEDALVRGAVRAVEEELRQLEARTSELGAAVRRLNAMLDMVPPLRPPWPPQRGA